MKTASARDKHSRRFIVSMRHPDEIGIPCSYRREKTTHPLQGDTSHASSFSRKCILSFKHDSVFCTKCLLHGGLIGQSRTVCTLHRQWANTLGRPLGKALLGQRWVCTVAARARSKTTGTNATDPCRGRADEDVCAWEGKQAGGCGRQVSRSFFSLQVHHEHLVVDHMRTLFLELLLRRAHGCVEGGKRGQD